MKNLTVELKKCKRTGILVVLPLVGLLGALYAFINFIVRKEVLLSLPLPPMDVLLTQLYGMVMVLNMFGIIVATTLTYLNNGRPIESKSWTEKLGVNQCFIRIQNHIMDTTGAKLPEEIINQFLRKGEIDVSSKYQNMVKEIAEQYVKELFDKLSDYEYNEDLIKLYVMGGGAKMVEMFGKYNPDRTTFNHDICANAKGYEYFCYMMLRQKMRK